MYISFSFSRRAETNEDAYIIPTGGSNEIGVYGYFTVFQEMITQVSNLHVHVLQNCK